MKFKTENEKLTIFKILNLNWLNLICLKILNIQMSLMQCKNSKILNAINKLSCCILTWIECLIFSFVFVVIGMYNLNTTDKQ